MIGNLKAEQVKGILDAMPFEMMFADETDHVVWANKIETRKFRFQGDQVFGKDLRGCHPPATLPKVEKILSDFKSGAADEAEFWIPSLRPRLLNRFLAIRDADGKYLGILEYLLDFAAIDQIAEDKKDAPKR